jgi:hypothetical protein
VGHELQVQQDEKRRMVFKMGHHAAIIGFEKVLQHQAGKQLMLGKLLGTANMTIERQRSPRGRQSRPNHRLRRLARNRHTDITKQKPLAG